MEKVKEEQIKINGGEIPITLSCDTFDKTEVYVIDIDGVEWIVTDNQVHAGVLFQMMKDHITEYMHYEKKKV